VDKWINDLREHNEVAAKKAVTALEETGEQCFEAVAELLLDPVGKWHAVPLLMRLSPARAVPLLLEIINRNRENSVMVKEHSKKYIRIKAINALGAERVCGNSELEELYMKHQVVEDLGYFIDPAHPHKHKEVIFAVEKALGKIDTNQAQAVLKRWRERPVLKKRQWTTI